MGFFDRLKKGLSKSRGNLTERVDELVETPAVVDDDFYEELTDILLLSAVGVRASTEIIDELRRRAEEKKVQDARAARRRIVACKIPVAGMVRAGLVQPLERLIDYLHLGTDVLGLEQLHHLGRYLVVGKGGVDVLHVVHHLLLGQVGLRLGLAVGGGDDVLHVAVAQ